MIHVARIPAPEGLAEKAQALLSEFDNARAKDSSLTMSKFWTKARRRLTGEAGLLAQMFSNKCGFCEAHMLHVSSPHVDHYRPKSRAEFERLAFDWTNWVNSCGRCNDIKWAHFPVCGADPCLVNPCEVDPGQHLQFQRALVVPLTERGRQTIDLVGLDRSPLEDQRASWMRTLDCLLLLLLGEARDEARALLMWCVSVTAPYSAMSRAYLSSRVPKLVAKAHPNAPEPKDVHQRLADLVARHASTITNLE